MTGKELGIPPLTSLREINIVQGKPCFSAQVMLSLVYQKVPGAIVNFTTPVEKQAEECTVEASRPGGKVQTFCYTIKMATRAGLTGKKSWRENPEAMLRARAVASAVRAVFPDAMSSCYLPEELAIDVHQSDTATATPQTESNAPLIERKTQNTVGYDKRHEEKMAEPCTPAQQKKFYAMTKALGLSDTESHEWLFENFGVDSSKDLSKQEIQQAFELLEGEINNGNSNSTTTKKSPGQSEEKTLPEGFI